MTFTFTFLKILGSDLEGKYDFAEAWELKEFEKGVWRQGEEVSKRKKVDQSVRMTVRKVI